MPLRSEQTKASSPIRLAGWFFVVLGFAILCFAVARSGSTFAPERPAFVLEYCWKSSVSSRSCVPARLRHAIFALRFLAQS